MMEYSPPDDDYWDDFEALHVMKTLNDDTLIQNIRKDDKISDDVMKDIIQK